MFADTSAAEGFTAYPVPNHWERIYTCSSRARKTAEQFSSTLPRRARQLVCIIPGTLTTARLQGCRTGTRDSTVSMEIGRQRQRGHHKLYPTRELLKTLLSVYLVPLYAHCQKVSLSTSQVLSRLGKRGWRWATRQTARRQEKWADTQQRTWCFENHKPSASGRGSWERLLSGKSLS